MSSLFKPFLHNGGPAACVSVIACESLLPPPPIGTATTKVINNWKQPPLWLQTAWNLLQMNANASQDDAGYDPILKKVSVDTLWSLAPSSSVKKKKKLHIASVSVGLTRSRARRQRNRAFGLLDSPLIVMLPAVRGTPTRVTGYRPDSAGRDRAAGNDSNSTPEVSRP